MPDKHATKKISLTVSLDVTFYPPQERGPLIMRNAVGDIEDGEDLIEVTHAIPNGALVLRHKQDDWWAILRAEELYGGVKDALNTMEIKPHA